MNITLAHNPHKYQEVFYRCCSLAKTNPYRFVCCVASRQSEKSLALQYFCILWLFGYDSEPKRIWYVLPSEPQARKVFENMLVSLGDSGLVSKAYKSPGQIEIRMINGSVLEFKSSLANST